MLPGMRRPRSGLRVSPSCQVTRWRKGHLSHDTCGVRAAPTPMTIPASGSDGGQIRPGRDGSYGLRWLARLVVTLRSAPRKPGVAGRALVAPRAWPPPIPARQGGATARCGSAPPKAVLWAISASSGTVKPRIVGVGRNPGCPLCSGVARDSGPLRPRAVPIDLSTDGPYEGVGASGRNWSCPPHVCASPQGLIESRPSKIDRGKARQRHTL